ncbi:MAG: hypothetical protein EA417_22270 [Gammaproteobacteria bacterium]|nr:MAG: hypothetical protein EA417_22270 [Gammaproteobacteria bacterium]
MTERVRNRLVGAIILLSLAVVVLPMLFDGAGIERRAVPDVPGERLRADRPVEPAEDPRDDSSWAFLDEVEARRAAAPVSGQARHEAAFDTEAEDAEASAPGLDLAGLPRAWSVQLASFRDADNARALRQRLLADGFDAYLIEEGDGGQSLYRVAVGPRIDRTAADRLRTELAERYELDGMVVRFMIGRSNYDGSRPRTQGDG